METSIEHESGQTIWYLQWRHDRLSLEHLFALADDSLDQIRRYRDLGDVIVAASQSCLVGHAQVISIGPDDTFEIKSIAVLQHHRRRGIGNELLKAAIRLCRDKGANRVTVSTAIASTSAIRFYLQHGFRACSIVRDAFTHATGYPIDATVEGLPLNDALEFELMLEPTNSRVVKV